MRRTWAEQVRLCLSRMFPQSRSPRRTKLRVPRRRENVLSSIELMEPRILLAQPTLTVVLNSATMSEQAGGAGVTATVQRTDADLSQALTVNLQSSDTTEATVPTSVVIPAGAASAGFTVTPVDDSLLDGSQTLQITASAPGFVYASTAGGGPVGLDTTFGTSGYSTVPLAYSLSNVYPDIILLPDGSSFSFGQTPGLTTTNWSLVRRSATGAVMFTSGLTFSNVNNVAPTSLALQTDGKILAVGQLSGGVTPYWDMVAVRYNPDGTLDLSFGTAGIQRIESSTSHLYANDVAVLSDGSIILAGLKDNNAALVKLTPNGQVDTTFGTNGFLLTLPAGYSTTNFKSLAIQSDGKILASGSAVPTGASDWVFFVARFSASGVLDASYDVDGLQFVDTNPTAASSDTLMNSVLQPDGKVVLVGYDRPSSAPGNEDWAVARLNTNGSLDTSFSGDGVTLLDFNGLSDYANDVVVQSDGRIVAMGEGFISPNGYELAAARFNSDGTLDTTFDGDGKLVLPSWTVAFEQIRAGELNAAGQLVFLAGYSTDMRVGRLNLGSSAPLDSLTVTDYETLTVALSQSTVVENAPPGGVTGTVTRGNSDISQPLTVTLQSSDTTEATVPASVVIPAGAVSTNFLITPVDDNLLDGSQTVRITASAVGYVYLSSNLSGAALDTSFGTNGYASVPLRSGFGGSLGLADLVLQPDGASISFELASAGTTNSWSLIRRTASGAADATFGTNGLVTTTFANFVSPTALALQPDGKIVAVGTITGGIDPYQDILVARYNANGSVDTSFGSGGFVRIERTTFVDPLAVAVLADGSILLAGREGSSSSLVKFTATGALDTTFGTSGILLISPSGYDGSRFTSLEIQSDGKILAIGVALVGRQSSYFVARYLTNGTLDSSYGTGGTKTFLPDPSNAFGTTLNNSALQADGKLVLVGSNLSSTFANDNWAIARLNVDGSLDTSFSSDGVDFLDFGGFNDYANDVVIQANGRIVVMGASASSSTGRDLTFVGYNVDGTRDTTFNNGDRLVLPSWNGTSYEQVWSGSLQADGRLVFLAGNDTDMRVGRLNLNLPTPSRDSLTVTDYETLTVSIAPRVVAENVGTGVAVGTVTRSSSGNLSQPLTVSLLSSNPAAATVPASVVIPAGAASANFAIAVVDDNTLGFGKTTQITASAAGFVYSSSPYKLTGLDTTYGTSGFASVPLYAGWSDVFPAIVIQPNGRTVSLSSTPGSDTSWTLARRTSNGLVDNSFGTGGSVSTSFTNVTGHAAPTALALQSDNKILAAGHVGGGVTIWDDLTVVRYNPDGSLDTSFATGGMLRLDRGTATYVNDISVLSDGSILVAGSEDSNAFLARITPAGVLDTSFGINGVASTSLTGYSYVSFKSLLIQSDGGIVAAGNATPAGSSQSVFFVARFLPGGALDTSFDGDGRQVVDCNPTATSTSVLSRAVLQADGKLVLVGYNRVGTGLTENWAIARLNANGSLDPSFSNDGTTLLDFNGLSDYANDVVVQADGRILVMGESFVSGNGYDLTVARFNSDGTLDTTFDGDGRIVLPNWSGTVWEQIWSGKLNSNGQLVFLAGSASDMRVGRLNIDTPAPATDVLTVSDYEALTVTIGPTSVSENAGPAALTATVTRGNTADFAYPSLTVTLTSSDTTELTVPATVVIPAGQLSVTFPISVVNDSIIDGTQVVSIQGAADGFVSISDTLSVLDDDANARPVASPQSVSTNEDSPLSGQVTATDPNNDPLQYAVLTNPAHGQVSMDLSGAYVYTPAADFFGTDTFQFLAYDGSLLSVAATVTITILPVNDAPVAVADSYTVDEDQVLTVTAPQQLANRLQMTSDPGDWVGQGNTYDYGVGQGTFTATTSPSHDYVRINFEGFTGGANFWWTEFASPLSGTPLTPGTYLGAERAAFHAQGKPGLDVSGQGRGSNTLTGYFVIQAIFFSANGQLETFSATFEQHSEGSAPALRGTVQYSTLSVPVAGVLSNDSDIDSAPLTAVLVAGPAHGTVQLNSDGTFTYTPANNYSGPDSFTYRSNDGSLSSAPAVVSLVVNSVPDAPSVQNQSFAVAENSANGTVVGTVVASDSDAGQTLSYAIQSSTLAGAFAINAQTGQITVANGSLLDYEQVTSATLTVTVTDNDNPALSTTALVTVAINDGPDRDIRMISATANGTTTLTVTYEVVGLPVSAFTLGAYSSADDQFGGDTLLRSVTINAPADLTVGTHVKTWTIGSGTGQIPLLGAGATELNTDYFLLFVADPADAVAEVDLGGINEDNVAVFTGVYHPAAGQVLVQGGSGADTITVVTGSSIAVTVNGTTYTYAVSDAAGVRVRTHDGDDTVDGSAFTKPLAVWSGAGSDLLTGGAAADSLYGGAGNDTLAGLGGNDSLFGGTEDDRYLFAANVQLGTDALNDNDGGIDTLDFSATTTQNVALNLALTSTQTVNANLRITLASWITFENIIGGALDDTFTGNWLSNVLAGGGGNDKYIFDTDGALGSDTIDESGTGTDTIDFSSTTTKGVSFNLGLTTPQIVNANLTLALTAGNSVENLIGGSLNDSLAGNDLANVLTGNAGNDTLTGGGGNDTVTGGAGNDSYVFDADIALGSDTLNESGGGVDALDFSPTTLQALVVKLDLATAQVVNGNLTLNLGSATTFENVIGGAQNDLITGNSLSNIISGGAGNDSINGSTGNDTLAGDAGNDSLVGAAGNDVYQFAADTPLGSDTLDETGGGTDTLDFSTTLAQAVAVNLGVATVQIVNANLALTLGSATTIENVIGGAQGDILIGSAINNAMTGGGGDDTVTGGAGNDTFLFDADVPLGSDTLIEATGGGTDTLDFSPTNYFGVSADLSNAALQAVNAYLFLSLGNAGAFENVIGSAQNDVLTGNALANVLSGGLGSDSLTGGAGNDSLTGGDGLDTLTGGDGNDTYNFDADTALGVDWVFETTTGGVDTLSFASTTTQSVTVDLMVAWYQVVNSNLTLFLSGPEVMENVVGGTLGDILAGNILANNLAGGAGDDILRGSDGNDVLVGGAGNDVLFGDFGDDVYQFDTDSLLGSDTIDEPGLSGTDLLDFSQTTTLGVSIDLSNVSTQVVNANLMLTLLSADLIANVNGGSLNDNITGNARANVLTGNAGDDTLNGGGLNDTLVGGAGNDTLIGGDDDDTYQFDADAALGADLLVESNWILGGVDLIDFSPTTTIGITIDLASTAAQVVNSRLTLTLSIPDGFEGVVGTSLADTIRGNTLNNFLLGGAGNDTVFGFGGFDILAGGSGADRLTGGDDNDILISGTISYYNESTKVLNRAALDAIMAEWTSIYSDYAERISHLRSGGGMNFSTVLNSTTAVTDGTAIDTLFGEGGLDWFWKFTGDTSPDLNTGGPETVN